MTRKQKQWFWGLIAAFVGAFFGSIDSGLALMLMHPTKFNLGIELKTTLETMLVLGGLVGLKTSAAYLKNAPVPPLNGETEFITKESTTTTMKDMLKLFTLVSLVLGAAYAARAGDVPATPPPTVIKEKAFLANGTLEPYGTLSWEGLDGEARLGAGANVLFEVARGFSLWGFGESDNTAHSVVDRSGLGIRYTGSLGKHVRGDAGVALGYGFETQAVFTRVATGLTLVLAQSKSFELAGRAAYAFDIDGDGKHGTATGRAFLGPTLTLKW